LELGTIKSRLLCWHLSREVFMSSLDLGQKAADTQAESSTHDQLEPGPTMTDRSDRIREIAYFLWLDEGCPEGEEERHWTTAEALLESEPEQRKRIEGEPPGEPVADAPAAPEVGRARRTAAE
jgi:Protein of unknown function (DUF2934)